MIGIKDQCFGVEIELTGITRAEAAEALAAYFETTPQRSYAKDDSIAFVDSILTGYEKKKVLMERFMEKGLPEQTHLKRSTGFER